MSTRVAALGLSVGLVLADSSVVVLALPEIYRELDTSVSGVVWVLVAFNLVLAAAALPAAHLARRRGPARVAVAGLGLFTAASLVCGLAPSLGALIAGRCAQAVGGAAAVCAALELLPGELDSERRAAALWATSGALGAALGPAIGGALTELISWESIFISQAPLALAAAAPLVPIARRETAAAVSAELRATGRPHLAANVALALISAALAAALFLVVLLLIEGWRMSPIAAAATVSVMPLAAILGGRLARGVSAPAPRAAAGAIVIAGGLAGLGLLPRATVAATIAPQVLVGLGLALSLSALTEAALAGRAPQAIHGGWTIAARHAGVVAGLLLLTPIFTSDLVEQRHDAELAGAAAVLDSPLDPSAKIGLAGRIGDRLATERGRVPVIEPAFAPPPDDPEERAEAAALQDELQDELDRAATHAFSRSFLLAAAIGLLALAPMALSRGRVTL